MVYTHDSKSCAVRLVGSSPTSGKNKRSRFLNVKIASESADSEVLCVSVKIASKLANFEVPNLSISAFPFLNK